MTLKRKALETLWENEKMLVTSIPTVFSTLSNREIIILIIFNMASAKAFNLDKSNILSFGKELRVQRTAR